MITYLSLFSSNLAVHNVVVNGFTIKTTVVDSVSVVNATINELKSLPAFKQKKVVGLDCEWRPYDDGQPPNKVATLQLCTENVCVIAQLFYLEYVPRSLRNFLSDPDVTFVGVRIGEDAEKLRNDYGPSVRNTTDIGELALRKVFGWLAFLMKPRLGLKDYASEVAGIITKKPMHVNKSDWQVRSLSYEQVPSVTSKLNMLALMLMPLINWLQVNDCRQVLSSIRCNRTLRVTVV